MSSELPNQALYVATAAILAGFGIALGVIRVAKWNYDLGRSGVRIAPHGQ